MNIKPKTVEIRVDNVLCPFCSSLIEFQIRNSMDRGLTFQCLACKIKIYIKNI